jgi:hypothetical protein
MLCQLASHGPTSLTRSKRAGSHVIKGTDEIEDPGDFPGATASSRAVILRDSRQF